MWGVDAAQRDLLRQANETGWVVLTRANDEDLRALVDEGLAERKMNPNGRRQSGIILTRLGERAVRERW